MWSQRKTLCVIKDIHSNPCLWDVNSMDYKNRNSKSDVFEVLAKKYSITAGEIEKKIQALKNQFRREHKKLLILHKNGLPKKRATWFGYKHLKFLLKGYGSRANHSANSIQEKIKTTNDSLLKNDELEMIPDEESENEILSECSIIKDSSDEEIFTELNCKETIKRPEFVSPPKPEKRKNNDSEAANTFKCTKNLTETVSTRDEHSIYGEHIANRLRNSGRSKLEIAVAQHEIDNVMFKLTMGGFSQFIHSSHSTAESPTVSTEDTCQHSRSTDSPLRSKQERF